jgi:hypothetical protein
LNRFNVIKLSCITLLVIHYGACLLLLVAQSEAERYQSLSVGWISLLIIQFCSGRFRENSWLDVAGYDSINEQKSSIYFMCLYLSASTIARLGYGDHAPVCPDRSAPMPSHKALTKFREPNPKRYLWSLFPVLERLQLPTLLERV